jgi:hypothetical protein
MMSTFRMRLPVRYFDSTPEVYHLGEFTNWRGMLAVLREFRTDGPEPTEVCITATCNAPRKGRSQNHGQWELPCDPSALADWCAKND